MTLYHATTNKSLRTIKPQPTLSNDRYIGDYVFATANRLLALMYLVPKGTPTLMNPQGDSPTIVICSNPAGFIAKDNGGAIYELPRDSFTTTPQEGLSSYEMVSKVQVTPIRKEIYDSTLRALVSSDIKVKFVDEKMFNHLIRNPNQKELISNLEEYNP